MTATYDTDPNTETVAAAWASSPIGRPEHEARYGFAPEPVTEDDAPQPATKHVLLAIGLAGGIAAGAALALMFVDTTPDQPSVVRPGSTSPQPAVVVTQNTQEPSPSNVAPAPQTAPGSVVTAPANAPHVGTAPATTVVDVPAPSNPAPADESELNDPQPPEPEDPLPPKPGHPLPPGPDDFKLPEPPKQDPPLFDPDLPLAPLPQPKPPTPSDFVPSLGLGS